MPGGAPSISRTPESTIGIDPDATTIGQAREIARLSGLAPEYLCGDFEDWDWQGRGFDTVLCLNVLHHLYDPVGALLDETSCAEDAPGPAPRPDRPLVPQARGAVGLGT